jgi:hypothetical protein
MFGCIRMMTGAPDTMSCSSLSDIPLSLTSNDCQSTSRSALCLFIRSSA